ncbi:MAG: hypothetical protein FJW96_04690 [Actinobacteria bacterium]|nr:hypothetical protein [Actinomycetota bacterium]
MTRPAWYALGPGRTREAVTLLHLPYTAWHLSYVVAGGCLAAQPDWGRLGLTVAAFFLAMGIAAHALDELAGRPLETSIPSPVLAGLAVTSLAGACAIGVVVAARFSWWILPLVAVGAFLVPAYNLELFGGRFHTDLWFALAWGAFPVVTAYVAVTGRVRLETAAGAAAATLLSLTQRRLSTSARRARRSITDVAGHAELIDGSRIPLTRETLAEAPEAALRLLTAATIAGATALALARLAE